MVAAINVNFYLRCTNASSGLLPWPWAPPEAVSTRKQASGTQRWSFRRCTATENTLGGVRSCILTHVDVLETFASNAAPALDLTSNRIYAIRENCFKRLVGLNHLSLATNSLYELPDEMFVQLQFLRSLSLSGNVLRHADRVYRTLYV